MGQSNRARVLSLAIQGTRPADIARETGLGVYTIYALLSTARKQGHAIPRFTGNGITRQRLGQELRFMVAPDIATRLIEEADRRNLRPAELARQLITTIADDNLFSAVLETEGEDG